LRYPNSTNLHTHGLHVTPGLVAPGVYGDFVMDDPRLGVQPGQVRQHEYRIGLDHPPGAYWYHPHLHGSTAIQIGSGMAGAKGRSIKCRRLPQRRARVRVPGADLRQHGRLESCGRRVDHQQRARS
jgi:hypothetical protein